MPVVVRTLIADIFNGRNRAYLYIWLSKAAGAVYVGQTNGAVGSLGRGYAHFCPTGQLRERMDAKLGVEPEDFHDFVLTSYLLPESPEFTGSESSYREAVEFRVQDELDEKRELVAPSYQVISRIRTNDRVRDLNVQLVAQQISADFLTSYNLLA